MIRSDLDKQKSTQLWLLVVCPCAPGLPLFQYKLMANLWLKVPLPLVRREAQAWVGDHGEGESRDSDCLCLSCLNGKTFTNGCGYRFCQRFVTSWYSHKNKYLHKFQVWEDAVDKPSRLVKCWGKR